MIEFDQIPSSIRKPGKYFEFNTRLAVRTLAANAQRSLVIGQRLAAGTVAAEVPTQVFSDAEAAVKFGRGSLCHRMVRAAIAANPYLDVTVVALDDAGAGVAATGTITIAGPATTSGLLVVYVGAERVELAVASAAAANATAAALQAELVKRADLAVTPTVADAVVTLTAKNKGTCGNQLHVSATCSAAGLTATVVAMASGATDPDVQDALDAAFAGTYDVVVTPYNTATPLQALRTQLETLSGPMEQRPGLGVYATVGALADSTTLAGTNVNSGYLTGCYLRGTKTPPYELAAAYGAVIAREEDPAKPLNTLELKGTQIPASIADWLGRTEQESCLANGVTPLEASADGRVRIVRAVTTYIKDPQGVADISLLDVTTIRTLFYVRKVCRERIALRFPRSKLNNRVIKAVRSELLDVLVKLEELEIVEEVAANKDGLVVERNLQDPNRLDAKIPCDVVNGLHVFAGRIDLLL